MHFTQALWHQRVFIHLRPPVEERATRPPESRPTLAVAAYFCRISLSRALPALLKVLVVTWEIKLNRMGGGGGGVGPWFETRPLDHVPPRGPQYMVAQELKTGDFKHTRRKASACVAHTIFKGFLYTGRILHSSKWRIVGQKRRRIFQGSK